MGAQDRSTIPDRLKRRLAEWQWLHRTWWAVHYGVGIIGVSAGALATLGDKTPIPVIYVGIVAAICTSLITFLGPLSKAQRYWLAFHEADQACFDYESSHINSKDLGEAFRRARAVITIGTSPVEQGESKRLERATEAQGSA